MKKILRYLFASSIAILGIQIWNSDHTSLALAKTKYQAVSPNQQQTLPLGLVGRNDKQLDDFIYQTVTPGNPHYRKYLTPHQFGRQYGLSGQNVKVVGKYMHQHHLKTDVYPGNLLMTVAGKTKDIENTFGIQIKQSTNRKHNYQVTAGQAKVDRQIAKHISYVDQDFLDRRINQSTKNKGSKPATTSASAEEQLLAKVKDPNIADRSFRKFGRIYNTASLYQNGNGGQHQTIGVLATADFKLRDIRGYWKKYGVDSNLDRIKKVYVDHNMATSAGDRAETSMDVQQASVMAPNANINVYIGNNYNNSDLLTSYATAISKDNVDVISNSYGGFESDVKPGAKNIAEVKILNQLLKQAAAQGITTFNASGDNGAYAFQDGSKKRSVGIPADSPYMTAVGGTILSFKDLPFSVISGTSPDFKLQNDKRVSIDHESAWNSVNLIEQYGIKYVKQVKADYIKYLMKKAKTKQQRDTISKSLQAGQRQPTKVTANQLYTEYSGSGGGFSSFFARPKYQQGVSGVGTYNAKQYINTKAGLLNHNPKLITGKASGRNVPDISGNASLLTGYSVYLNGHDELFGGNGTSVITPQMAGMAAVINSAQGQRTGFWNPQLYRFAQQSNSPFTPLNRLDDNNLYYTGQPGKLYNQSTGLGTVDFTKLNQAFSAAK
ncbi:S53 family peptidase [Lactobacillaceae bacterium Melli_B4]